jgi:PKD repeat protein
MRPARSNRLAVLLVPLALATGCAHRLPLWSPQAPLHGLSGVPVAVGAAPKEPVPEGTTVKWDFGDVTHGDGTAAAHAFAQAGTYVVTQTVADKSGERQSTLSVEVDRRSPWMAVPPGVGHAVVFDRVFNRMGVLQQVLGKLMPDRVEPAFQALGQSLGFDPRVPENVRAAGLDPDEGLAWFSYDDEPQAGWLAFGTYDDAKFDAAVRKALGAAGATFAAGPDGWTYASLGGLVYPFKADRGYAYLRVPLMFEESPTHLERVAAMSALGLLADPVAARSLTAAPQGEVVGWWSQEGAARLQGGAGPYLLGAFAVGLKLSEAGIGLEANMPLLPEGQQRVAALVKAPGAPTLLTRAPPGAAMYAAFSGDVPAFLSLLDLFPGAGTEGATQLADTFRAQGLDLKTLLDQAGHDVAVAGYFDAAEFFRGAVETGELTPRGDLLLGLTVKDPKLGAAALDRVLAAGKVPVGREAAPGGQKLQFTVQMHPAGALWQGDALTLAWGTRQLDALAKGADAGLGRTLAAALPKESLGPGQLVFWADIGRVVRAIGETASVPGVQPGQLLQARIQAQVTLGMLTSLQDVWLWVQPQPAALHVQGGLRFR